MIFHFEGRGREGIMSGARRKVFVVLSASWFFNDEYTTYSDDQPLKAFNDRPQAEAFLARLQQCERANDDGEDPSGRTFSIVEMEVDG
jgi:hypothetical protein